MAVMEILIATGAAIAAPQHDPITLVDFLDAMQGRCWVVDAEGLAVPETQLPALTGDVEIECLNLTAKDDRRI